MENSTAFVTAPLASQFSLLKRKLCSVSNERRQFLSPTRSRPRIAPTQLLQHAHSLPDIINQLVISCGVGLAGIVGSKATEQVRALTEGDQRADAMEKIALEIDSFRRRKELSEHPGDRDWSDVGVDKLSNIVITEEHVPMLRAHDEFQVFDSLLGANDNISSSASTSSSKYIHKNIFVQLPQPSEFVLDEETDAD